MEATRLDELDDAGLAVRADALIEQGDPRGELIALSLQPPSPARDRRLASHVRKHARALLGDLASVVLLTEHLVFERDVLVACAITSTPRARLEAVTGHPDLRTVRSIRFRNYSGGAIEPLAKKLPHPAVAFLADGVLARLEEALGLGVIDVFAPLAASDGPLGLRHVHLVRFPFGGDVPASVRGAIAGSRAFPQLRRLGIEDVLPPDWLLEARWFGQIEEVELGIQGPLVGDALVAIERRAPRVRTVVFCPHRVFDGGDRPQWVYTARKRGARFTSIEPTPRGDVGPDHLKKRRRFLAEIPRTLEILGAS